MELLPTELKEHILKFLSTEVLEDVVCNVSDEWAEIATEIVGPRLEKLLTVLSTEPHTIQEIRNRLHPSKQEDNKLVLRTYEKAYLNTKFEIRSHNLGTVPVNMFQEFMFTRACDCRIGHLCTIRAIHFMHCHQLIVVQMPEKIVFYSMSNIQSEKMDEDFGKSCLPYSTSVSGFNDVKNVWIDNNTHTAVSVYQDKIVSQETTRVLILFRVAEVDHNLKTVVLQNIRRIFLPLWSCSILLLEDKVCALFTTGTVGIWKMDEDDIVVSGNTCGDNVLMRSMQMSRMYRLNHLVLIKIVSNEHPTAIWTIFDSSDCNEGFQLHSLQFNTLINNNFVDGLEICCDVFDMFMSTNMLMIYCRTSLEEQQGSKRMLHSPKSSRTQNSGTKLLVKRIRKTPLVEHFLDPEKFNEIFESKANGTKVAEIYVNGSVTMPYYPTTWNKLGDLDGEAENCVLKLLGLHHQSKRSVNDEDFTRSPLSVVAISVINS